MACLFSTGFQFVGLTTELANDKDFVCLDHPGIQLVVQNFRGTLRAFQNVCSHRFSKIQTEDRGNRVLACRYHGWAYDIKGYPAGMPRRSEYVVDDIADLCLSRYRIETCGKFVFVDLSNGDGSLQDHLGSFYDMLEGLSPHIGAEVAYSVVPHRANWKILVENVLDNLHCQLLHRETFLSAGFCKLPLEDTIIEGDHSSYHVPRAAADREGIRRRALSHLQGRTLAHESFLHILVFPNLFVASTEGMQFYVGHAVPVSVDETHLRVRYFEPAIELEPRQRARQDMINAQSNATGARIIEEDRPILEDVQRGMNVSDKPGFIAASEERVHAFLTSYQTRMAGAAST